MHSKIFQVSKTPISKKDWIYADMYLESFVGRVADYTDDIDDAARKVWLENLSRVPGLSVSNVSEQLMIVSKEEYFREYYKEFKEMIDKLSKVSLRDFCEAHQSFELNAFRLQSSISDEFGYYVDIDEGYPMPLQDYVRCCDDGDKLYIGGIVDYHY